MYFFLTCHQWVIAQNRETAEVFSMPENAIKTGCVDLILPIDEIADGIVNMVLA
ncbi:MAG: chemotaxis protein CheB [Cyanobacteria bacterium J06600_6]